MGLSKAIRQPEASILCSHTETALQRLVIMAR
jgi:hypothetical protein